MRKERGLQRPVVAADPAALHWIECVLELLDDFQQRGLLQYVRRTTRRVPHGRIDWRTTVRRETVCLSQGNSIYLDPFRFAVEAYEDHPLTELHRETMRNLLDLFSGDLARDRPEPANTRVTQSTAKKILGRERNRVFRDRDRRVVQLLAQYWLGSVTGRLRGFRGDLLWTDQFEFIWQRMTERVIGGDRTDNHGMPKGEYQEFGAMRSAGLRLRPDLVVDVTEDTGVTRIVFDAKYYTSHQLPSSHDILKQLAYSYFSSQRWARSLPDRVLTVFLLPGNSPRERMQLCGRHRLLDLAAEQRGRPLADDIWLFRIDYRALAASYLAGARWKCTEFLERIRIAMESDMIAAGPA